MNRELDGIFFRIERDEKWQNICFSDMTEEEMRQVLKDKDTTFLTNLCVKLGLTIQLVGNFFNITAVDEEDEVC